jgi:ABC-type branched-subunit amino acid transport system ATPase component
MIVVEQNVAFTLGLARRFIVMKQGAIALAGETAAPNARSLIDEQLAL